MESLGRHLMVIGALVVLVGLLVQLAPSLPFLGRLPGDLRIERPGLRVHLPLATCLLLSAVATGLLWLVGRLR